jgi:hypothetical protein
MVGCGLGPGRYRWGADRLGRMALLPCIILGMMWCGNALVDGDLEDDKNNEEDDTYGISGSSQVTEEEEEEEEEEKKMSVDIFYSIYGKDLYLLRHSIPKQ